MSLCRTCLSENELKPLFSDKSQVGVWCKQLYLVTGVKIEPNDGLPQLICTSCTNLIQLALNLRKKSSKSHEILRKTYTNNIKKESEDEYVKDEHNIEYYTAIDQQATGQLNNELNLNLEHKKKKYTFIQIQNIPGCTVDNLNSEHNNIGNLKSEHEKTVNLKLEHETDDKMGMKQKHWLKKFGEQTSGFKYSVSIEDFESSGDEDFAEDICIDDLESDGEEQIATVRIEDFESSDSVDLDDFKCDSSNLDDIKNVEERSRMISQQMKEKELFEREKRKLTSMEQDRKLLSLAMTPYDKRGPVKCRLCDRVIRTVQSFKNHAKTHFELENTCEECGKKFVSRSTMRYHQQRKHGRTKRLACTRCAYRAVDLQALQNHERAEHTGERPYICNECGDSFRMRANIVQHMRKHFGVRNLQCDRCPAMFRSRSELWGHQNKVHFMVYTYQCYLCPETYKRPVSVKKHLTNVHGVPEVQQLQIKCVKIRRK